MALVFIRKLINLPPTRRVTWDSVLMSKEPTSSGPPVMPDPLVPALRRGSDVLSSSLSADEDSLSSYLLFSYRQGMAPVESICLDILYSNVQFGYTLSAGLTWSSV